MAMTKRNGGSGTVAVNVRPQVKTCPEEAGIFQLDLDEGTKLVVLAHLFYPSHDRPAVAAVHKMLQNQRDLEASRPEAQRKKIAVMLLGGILHEEAFKAVIDEQDQATKLLRSKPIPELTRIRKEHESIEARFLALGKAGGDFIREFGVSCGGPVLYVPSVTGMLPNEIDFMRFVIEKKKQLDDKADKHFKEAKKGPPIPEDIAEFLGLNDDPNVKVLPFGAAIEVNDDVRFLIGDFRRANPGTASQREAQDSATNMSVVRSFDGKAASTWWTTPEHTLGEAHRVWWQAHEVPCMFDIKAQLGYLRRYDRRGTGFWAGKIVGGKVNGTIVELAQGDDKRRSFFVYGRVYAEDAPSQRANVSKLVLPGFTRSDAQVDSGKETPTAEASDDKGSARKPASRKSAPKKPAARKASKRTGGSREQK